MSSRDRFTFRLPTLPVGLLLLLLVIPVTAEAQVFVTPLEAENMRAAGATVLDTRGYMAFLRSHAPGAVRVDWTAFSDPSFQGRLHPDDNLLVQEIRALGVRNDRPVLVMGDWNAAWGEEGRIFWMLEFLGHDSVHIVSGGFGAWRDADLPVTQSRETPERGNFTVTRRHELELTTSEVAEGAVTLLDVRARREYDGATPYGSVRGGHVPGAVHFDWRSVFDESGALLDADALDALLPDGPTGAYCTGGVRSGFIYAVMRSLGRDDVANYAGSWWEYAASSHPVE